MSSRTSRGPTRVASRFAARCRGDSSASPSRRWPSDRRPRAARLDPARAADGLRRAPRAPGTGARDRGRALPLHDARLPPEPDTGSRPGHRARGRDGVRATCAATALVRRPRVPVRRRASDRVARAVAGGARARAARPAPEADVSRSEELERAHAARARPARRSRCAASRARARHARREVRGRDRHVRQSRAMKED